jgi:hypothetical protein
MFQSNNMKAAKNKAAITAEIRRRALERRRAWEMLGDAYLEVSHKWTAHVEQVEKDEGGLKEGPKLRGSASALFGGGLGIGALGSPGGLAGGLHAGLGLPAGLGALGGQLAALGGVSGDQLGGGVVSTRSFDLAAASSRASGLGIARSDYEQVPPLVISPGVRDLFAHLEFWNLLVLFRRSSWSRCSRRRSGR